MPEKSQTEAAQTPEPASPAFLPPRHRISALLFLITTFFFWASLYLYTPILPVYAQSLGASLPVVGIIVASYGLPQLLFRIPLGIWSDALGRQKPLAVGGVAIALVSALVLALATTPPLLIVGRFAAGMGAATWVVFTIYFVAFYPREATGRAIGILGFTQSIALIMTSVSGGMIAEYLGSRQTFFGAAILAALSLVVLLPAKELKSPVRHGFAWSGFSQVAFKPQLLLVCVMAIILNFVQFSTVFGFIPVSGARIGASSADLGIISMLAQIAGAISSLSVPLIAERRSYGLTLLLGSVLLSMSLLAVPFIGSVYWLEADQFISGLGRGMLSTTLMTLSIRAIAPPQRATAMGVYQATYSIGMLSGPLVSGFLADSLGLEAVYYLSAAAALLIAGGSRLRVFGRR